MSSLLCVHTDNGSQCMFDDSESQGRSMQCGSGGSQPNITRTCLQKYVSSLFIVSYFLCVSTEFE